MYILVDKETNDRQDHSSENGSPRETALTKISSNSKLQTRPLVREDSLKENLKEKEKLVAGPRWAPVTKIHWSTDCRS
jgi:hypothetical protein